MSVGSLNISMQPVESSSISAFGYDSSVGALRIKFKGGKSYTYQNVPASVVEELKKAESVGSFVNRNIVRKYETVRDQEQAA